MEHIFNIYDYKLRIFFFFHLVCCKGLLLCITKIVLHFWWWLSYFSTDVYVYAVVYWKCIHSIAKTMTPRKALTMNKETLKPLWSDAHDNHHLGTLDLLWKFWLVKSLQSIFNNMCSWVNVKFKVCLVSKPLACLVFSNFCKLREKCLLCRLFKNTW